MEPLVYKRCLAALQAVVDLKSRGNDVGSGSIVLGTKFDALRAAMIEASRENRANVMLFLMKTCFQAFSLAIDTYTCKIRDVKIGLIVTSCLASSLRLIRTEGADNRKKGHNQYLKSLFYGQEEMRTCSNELLLTLLALMEGLNGLLNDRKSATALVADHEECFIQCFQVYSSFVQIWMQCATEGGIMDDQHEQPLRGNFLAQIVQICLRSAMNESRGLSERALECLFSSICYVNDANEWRRYYPGCFGGLFALSTAAGKSRGASSRFAAVVCLLRLTILIATDDDSCNASLLKDVEHPGDSGVNGSSPASEHSDSKAAFSALMRKLLGATEPSDESVVSTASNAPIIPPEFESKEAFMQWRVDLLQRIQKHLPVAFTTAFEACSGKHCARLQHWLALLLFSCRRFLGNYVFVDFTCTFLRGLQHEAPIVRLRTRSLWAALRDLLRDQGQWPSISSLLMEKCVQVLRALGDYSVGSTAGGNERVLLMHLHSALSLGQALGSDLRLTLRAAGPDLALSIASLASPDAQTSHSLTLQSQKYACSPGPSSVVVGAHYRCSMAVARDARTGQALRTLCVLLGRESATSELLMAAGRLQGELEGIERSQLPIYAAEDRDGDGDGDPSSGAYDDKTHVVALQRLTGAWQAVSYAVLGLATLPNKETDTTTSASASLATSSGFESLADIEIHVLATATGNPLLVNHVGLSSSATPPSVNSLSADVSEPMELLADASLALPLRPSPAPQPRETESDHSGGTSGTSRSSVNGLLDTGSQDRACLDSVCKAVLAALHYHLPMLHASPSGQKAQMRALLLSACAEILGHVALLLRSSFQVHLVRCLYPLLELRVSPNSSVSQAASTALDRMGLYLGCTPVGAPGLLHQSFDYFVDEACSRLRSLAKGAVGSGGGGGDGGVSFLSRRQTADSRTHLVVDFVLSLLSPTKEKDREKGVQSSSIADAETDTTSSMSNSQPNAPHLDQESAAAAMKELLLDAVGSMDSLAGAGVLARAYSRPLLSMMLVLTERAAEDPTQGEATMKKDEDEELYLASAVSSLKTFRKAIHVLLERDLEDEDEEDEERQQAGPALSPAESMLLGNSGEDLLLLAQKRAKRLTAAKEEAWTPEQEKANQEQGEEKREDDSASSGSLAGLRLVDAILRRCSFYLSLPQLADQVSVLRVMDTAIRRMSADKSLLLPAVHKLWPPLVSKLREMRISAKEEAAERAYAGRDTRLLLTQDPSTHRAKILALPQLLCFLETAARLCGDFLSVKFSDDIWPELFLLLELVNPVLTTSAWETSSSPSGKTRETLDVSVEAVIGTPGWQSRSVRKLLGDAEGKGEELHGGATSPATANNKEETSLALRAENKYSLESKIKLSLLSCVEAVARVPACQAFVRRAVGKCTWHVLPLLSSSQCKEVNDTALNVLKSLQVLDASLVGSIAHTMAMKGPSGVSRRGVIAADPRIGVSVAEVERVYANFASDNTCSRSIRDLLKPVGGQLDAQSFVTPSFGEILKRHARM